MCLITGFRNMGDLVKVLRDRGVGAMELVAMELKMRGSYIARTLSYEGVTFEQRVCILDFLRSLTATWAFV